MLVHSVARLTQASAGLPRLGNVAVVVQQLIRLITALEVRFSQQCGRAYWGALQHRTPQLRTAEKQNYD